MRPRLSTSAVEDDEDSHGRIDSTSPIATASHLAPNTIHSSSDRRDAAGARSQPRNNMSDNSSSSASLNGADSNSNKRLSVSSHTRRSFESRTSIDIPDNARSRRSSRDTSRDTHSSWPSDKPETTPLLNGNGKSDKLKQQNVISVSPVDGSGAGSMPAHFNGRRSKFQSRWSNSFLTFSITALAILALGLIVQSFTSRQIDEKGCRMSYMRPAFAKLEDFDTEHTRFASKYSVYLYREAMVDEDTRVHIASSLWRSMLTMTR